MPCRNIVPKPARSRIPLWVAGKPDVAARYGMGCLGFNVVGGRQAKIMVDQYYDTLTEDCVPIGHAVNANIGVLATLHCHEDADVAQRHGEHLKFFGYTIGKYLARPGRAAQPWDEFLAIKDKMPAMGDSPTSAIGTPTIANICAPRRRVSIRCSSCTKPVDWTTTPTAVRSNCLPAR